MHNTRHTAIKCIWDKDDYIRFIDYIKKYYFNDTYETEQYFGLELPYNEDTGEYTSSILEYEGEIKYCPSSFPAIIYYDLDESQDRIGKVTTRVLSWATFEELGISDAKLSRVEVKQCKFKTPLYKNYFLHGEKCKSICDGFCNDCEDYEV